MNRARNLWISLAAALVSVLLVYGVYAVLIRQVDMQRTVRVVVPKAFIPAGTAVTREMLDYRVLTEGGLREGMLREAGEAVGMVTLVPLGSGEPVLGWKLDRFHLQPGPGQATFSIPKEYVLSVPGGIRAGDRIAVYASGKAGTVRLLPEDVTVASVKSSANLEVDDPKDPHLMAMARNDKEKMVASRRDANGTVEQMNLNLTEEEWRMIDEACRSKQNKLVIAVRGSPAADQQEGRG